MANSFGLGIDPTANNPDHHPEPVDGIAYFEWFVDCPLPGRPVEVLVHGLAVDQNRPAFVQVKTNLGDGSLTLSSCVEVFLLSCSLYQVKYLHYCCVWAT